MNQQDRIKNLENIQKTPPLSTKKIWYNKQEQWRDVFSIPLEYLMYNPYNGRIMSAVKTFEKQFREINLDSEDDKVLIEAFIWDSAPDYNKHTLKSLKEYGQNEIGIVTKDGIIIDGNRRACLLNLLNKQDGGNRQFLTVILPDILQGNREKIDALETIYQIGVDDKVDYNPVEKYLKAEALSNFYSADRIADMMAESETTIINYGNILALMEDYLTHCGYPKIYTRLSKREGHFVDLNNYLKSYRKFKSQNVDWSYDNNDLIELKKVYFDYIRLGLPVGDCRVIGRSRKSDSFFCNETIWSSFKETHYLIFKETNDLTITEYKLKYGGEDINQIILDRDEWWVDTFGKNLINNLENNSRILEDKKNAEAPIELIKRARNSLQQIRIEALNPSQKDDVKPLLDLIRQRLGEIEQKLIP